MAATILKTLFFSISLRWISCERDISGGVHGCPSPWMEMATLILNVRRGSVLLHCTGYLLYPRGVPHSMVRRLLWWWTRGFDGNNSLGSDWERQRSVDRGWRQSCMVEIMCCTLGGTVVSTLLNKVALSSAVVWYKCVCYFSVTTDGLDVRRSAHKGTVALSGTVPTVRYGMFKE